MIQAYPTKHGTGISIFGDYGDLNTLYETVHQIANSLDEIGRFQKGQHLLLMNFAYEIRKAFSSDRLKEKHIYNGDTNSVDFYGFQVVWTDILIFTNVLRRNAGYFPTNRLHQGTLYYLEYIIEKALFDYDAEGANNIKDFIGQRINILDLHVFQIYQALHVKFVSERPGKARFRKISNFITSYFSPRSIEYIELVGALKDLEKEHKCDSTDLEYSDFQEIKW